MEVPPGAMAPEEGTGRAKSGSRGSEAQRAVEIACEWLRMDAKAKEAVVDRVDRVDNTDTERPANVDYVHLVHSVHSVHYVPLPGL